MTVLAPTALWKRLGALARSGASVDGPGVAGGYEEPATRTLVRGAVA